jgi:hypothetical protein
MTAAIHHLADAIAALRAAWEAAGSGPECQHIMNAESDTFRALKAIVDGQWQFDPEPDAETSGTKEPTQ